MSDADNPQDSSDKADETWLDELMPETLAAFKELRHEDLQFFNESVIDEIQELTNAPSDLLWSKELNRIVNGERAARIMRLGEASQLVQVIIDSSKDRELARKTFNEAFAELLREWSPSLTEDSYAQEAVLSLIAAYKPTNGFIKLSDYLRHDGRFPSHYNPLASSSEIDLHLMALAALRSYYRSAPPRKPDPGFKTYTGILRQHLATPVYCGYAATELLKLEILNTRSRSFLELIASTPACLEDILVYLLTPARRTYAPEDLRNVYAHCLEIGSQVVQLFESIINRQGGTIEYISEIELPLGRKYRQESILIPVIVSKDGSRWPIMLSPEQIEGYTQRRYGQLQHRDLDEILHDPLISRTALEKELTRRLEQILHSEDLRDSNQSLEEFEAELEGNKAYLVTTRQEVYVKLQNTRILSLRSLSEQSYNLHWQITRFREHWPEYLTEDNDPEQQLGELVSRGYDKEKA